VVALDEAMRERLIAGGAGASRVEVIDNWCCEPSIVPARTSGNPLRRRLGVGDDELLVSYSGNLGQGHDVETIVGAAARLADDRVRWLFVGDGPRRAELERAVRERDLAGRVLFLPYQPAGALATSLTAADASLVTLRADLAGLLCPSKLYGLLAAGVPVIYVGPAAGRAHEVAGEGGAGVSLRNGDVEGLVAAIRRLVRDPAARAALGARGRRLHEERFAADLALARHERLLARVATGASARASAEAASC
jgi:glycosyltransferase involved in cell wall biosynthesis